MAVRAGALTQWSEKTGGPAHELAITGSSVVADHVSMVVGEHWTRCVDVEGDDSEACLYEWSLSSELSSAQRETLEVLRDVLVVIPPANMLALLALDSYRTPVDDLPSDEWELSAPGALVNAGKYRRSRSAPKKLAGLLVDLVNSHMLLSQADVIISVPGHAQGLLNFGERLAANVAQALNVDLIETQSSAIDRPQAKDLGRRADEILMSHFSITQDLSRRKALVVDDVTRSGATMSAVAQAAMARGVLTVCGVAGAMTLRQ